MSKYAEQQVKRLLEDNKASKFYLKVKIQGEFGATNWMSISQANAKILARIMNN